MNELPHQDALFDLANVFEVEDHLFVYGDDLSPERSSAEVALWTNLLELNAPLSILDLACGFGRHANRLAALGHSVTGLDIMPGFLELARQEAESMGLQVEYQQGDMRQLNYQAEFDRVILLFTSFGYFTDEQNLHVLHSIARALKPGGLLGLDIPNREVMIKGLPVNYVTEKGKDLIIDRLSFEPGTNTLHNRRILIRDGVRKDKPHAIRLYDADEIRGLIDQAGLEVDKLLGAGGELLTDDSRRLLVIASKPKSN